MHRLSFIIPVTFYFYICITINKTVNNILRIKIFSFIIQGIMIASINCIVWCIVLNMNTLNNEKCHLIFILIEQFSPDRGGTLKSIRKNWINIVVVKNRYFLKNSTWICTISQPLPDYTFCRLNVSRFAFIKVVACSLCL